MKRLFQRISCGVRALLIGAIALWLIGFVYRWSSISNQVGAALPALTWSTSGTVEVGTRLLPLSSVDRWSQETYSVQVVVNNLATQEQQLEVVVRTNSAFRFVQQNGVAQTLREDGQVVAQQIVLPAKINDEAPFRELVFQFQQQPYVSVGTHNFDIQVVAAKVPLVQTVAVLEVLERYNLPVGNAPSQPSGDAQLNNINPSIECSTVYVVQPGDEFRKIAATYNTSMEAIAERNPDKILDWDNLQINTELCIP